ncbi:MAG: GyrI-like domain-containing protein [Citrobacter freundii]|nr:MAG: GyrI-like domain-containing protein [Citrobacter freundii]
MLNRFPAPEIKNCGNKLLAGKHTTTSLTNNKTGELWRTFMPLRSILKTIKGNDLYSLQLYPADYFLQFNPSTSFEKWAMIEVASASDLPEGIETFSLQDGLYAVFHYKGSSLDTSIFQYIFTQWLPESGYVLDDRPHFELLGEKYKNGDPESEEEIWIPVKNA